MYLKYVGELFLNMLKCIIIPLVVPSLIASIGKVKNIFNTEADESKSSQLKVFYFLVVDWLELFRSSVRQSQNHSD